MTETAKCDIARGWHLLGTVTHSPLNLTATAVDATIHAPPGYELVYLILNSTFPRRCLFPFLPWQLSLKVLFKVGCSQTLRPCLQHQSSSSYASEPLNKAKTCLACFPCAEELAVAEGVIAVYLLQKIELSLMLIPTGFLSLVCLMFCCSRTVGGIVQLLTSLKWLHRRGSLQCRHPVLKSVCLSVR